MKKESEIWAGGGRLGSLESKLFVYVLFRTILSSVELKEAKIMLEIHTHSDRIS